MDAVDRRANEVEIEECKNAVINGELPRLPDDDLARLLRALTVLPHCNMRVETLYPIWAETINRVLLSRSIGSLEGTIKTLDAQNERLSKRVYALTVIGVVLAALQVVIPFVTYLLSTVIAK